DRYIDTFPTRRSSDLSLPRQKAAAQVLADLGRSLAPQLRELHASLTGDRKVLVKDMLELSDRMWRGATAFVFACEMAIELGSWRSEENTFELQSHENL